MAIKNKFLRFITSVFISIFIYFLFALSLGFEEDPIGYMVTYAIYGFFFVIPFLYFMVYVFYILLTKKEERSKNTSIKKIILFLIIIALLYLSAQFTDLFG